MYWLMYTLTHFIKSWKLIYQLCFSWKFFNMQLLVYWGTFSNSSHNHLSLRTNESGVESIIHGKSALLWFTLDWYCANATIHICNKITYINFPTLECNSFVFSFKYLINTRIYTLIKTYSLLWDWGSFHQ